MSDVTRWRKAEELIAAGEPDGALRALTGLPSDVIARIRKDHEAGRGSSDDAGDSPAAEEATLW